MVPKGAGEPVDPLGTTQHPLTMGEAATYLSVCSLRQPSPAALEGHGKIPGETRDKEEPTSGQGLSAKQKGSLLRKRLLNTP